MFLFMSSWSRRYFSAASAAPLLVSSWAGLPVFADCQWKGQPSFSQRRMSLPVPHPPQRVHKNLHNSGRKCQYIESMAISRLRHYSCLLCCDLDELAEQPLGKRSVARWWIVLRSCRYTGTGYNVTCALFFGCYVWRKDMFWRIWARRNQPLLFLTGFW